MKKGGTVGEHKKTGLEGRYKEGRGGYMFRSRIDKREIRKRKGSGRDEMNGGEVGGLKTRGRLQWTCTGRQKGKEGKMKMREHIASAQV